MLDINDSSDIEEYKKKLFSDSKITLLLAKVVSATMFLLGIIMAITTHIEGNHAMVIVSLTYGPLFLISFIVTLITNKPAFFLVLGYILSFAMEFVFLLTGGQEGFGIFWMCIITLFTFFSNQKRVFFYSKLPVSSSGYSGLLDSAFSVLLSVFRYNAGTFSFALFDRIYLCNYYKGPFVKD